MNISERQHAHHVAYETLREQCEAINAPLWRFTCDGSMVTPPAGISALARFFTSQAFTAIVETQARRWADGQRRGNTPHTAELVEVFPGCWLAPMLDTFNRGTRRCGSIYIAALLGSCGFPHPQFANLAQAADLTPEHACAALAEVAVHTRNSAQAVATLLARACADLSVTQQSRTELESVTVQLGEAYEEIDLLHKLGDSMNALTEPQRFVQLVCDELLAMMPFRWVAAFVDRESSDPNMQTLFCAGTAPFPRQRLAQISRELQQQIDPAAPRALGHDYPLLAELQLGESIVQPVLRNGQAGQAGGVGEVVGVLLAGGKAGPEREVTSVDVKRLEAAAGYIAVLLENARLYEDQQAMFLGTLHALTSAIDAKDPYTRGHSQRVAYLAETLSQVAGLPDDICQRNRISGLVHDIGKIGVRESVLCKNGRLTAEEFEEIKRHPEIGHHILCDIPRFGDLLPGVLHHHERYDGRGYPAGLHGEQTPLQARIICLVDAFDAMSSTRTYRAAMDRRQVLEEIRRGAGVQFDPALAQAFSTIKLDEYDRMVERHQAPAQQGNYAQRSRELPQELPKRAA